MKICNNAASVEDTTNKQQQKNQKKKSKNSLSCSEMFLNVKIVESE